MTFALAVLVEEPTDADLLATIARRRDDSESARQAQAEFFERHVRYLYGMLMRRVARPFALSASAVEDLVQDTFFRAFERAHTFRADEIADPVRLERRARAWLGRIAERLLADSMKRLQEISASPYLEQLSTEDLDADAEPSKLVPLLQEALNTLSERERDVLAVAATYHRLGEPHQRLPNAVSAELAARWGISSENVRAVRSRALKKLKHYLREHGLAEWRES